MKVVGLISGGKDSVYNLMQCIASGHCIVALANIKPPTPAELNSYMYQTVGSEAIELVATSIGIPLFQEVTQGCAIRKDSNYEEVDDNDEVEDLYRLLKQVQEAIPDLEAVSVGAILSDYQRLRVENVCRRLQLTPLAYLWRRDQKVLLEEMVNCGVDAVVIKVAALGLDPHKHLRRSLATLTPYLIAMNAKYGLNVCGEGGEYETLTLDCPLYNSKIVIDECEIIVDGEESVAPAAHLKLDKLSLHHKLLHGDGKSSSRYVPVKDSNAYVSDFEEIENVSPASRDNRPINTLCANEFQHEISSTQSCDGWLWIGGIHADNTSGLESALFDALNQLKVVLSKWGHDETNVCQISLFVPNLEQFSQYNEVYSSFFNHINPPTRVCVEASLEKNSYTLGAISWKSLHESKSNAIQRHTMHVQSRSHWAPSNIGPYSQLTRIGSIIHVAGQIGLVPGTMELVKGGVRPQCRLTIRHIARILEAVPGGGGTSTLRDVVQAICYVVDPSVIDLVRYLWEEKTRNSIVNFIVVRKLPKNAQVEWHVWAHRHNNQFEYEETGKIFNSFAISLYKRWAMEDNIGAVVCNVENSSNLNLTPEVFTETLKFIEEKFKTNDSEYRYVSYMIIYFSVLKCGTFDFNTFPNIKYVGERNKLIYTLVPVVALKNEHTYFSICGIRHVMLRDKFKI